MTNVEAYDKAMMEALQGLEAVYQEDGTATPERLEALSILISTYDATDADSEFARSLPGVLAEGHDLADVREVLARDAGINDLAMLRHFATLDLQIENGEITPIHVSHLSDEELLRLMNGEEVGLAGTN